MNVSKINVIKASGEKEPFSEKKVRRSIRRARVPKEIENQVINHIYKILYDGIPTHKIYKQVSEFLARSTHPYTRAVYSLKQAIMQLGPGGFPFEKFIAAVLTHHGYKIKTNVILSGKCVEHEIDIVAEKRDLNYVIECKFHNRPGARSDVKVALYTQARFKDLQAQGSNLHTAQKFNQVWLVTNTKTTTEAVKYANCVGMKVIGWNYPKTHNLQELIEEDGLHPVTCLTTISRDQIQSILNQGIVLCKELVKENLKALGISQKQRDQITSEVKAICGNSK